MEMFHTPAAAGGAVGASSSTKRPTTTLRLLCPSSRAAALRPLRDLHVEQAPVGDEAVLTVSGADAPAAAVKAWERVVGHRVGGDEAEKGEEEREVAGAVGCRMLAASWQVGCVLGKGGKTVERMRQESGAQIRVFRNREQLPPCAVPGDELIHVRLSKSLVALVQCRLGVKFHQMRNLECNDLLVLVTLPGVLPCGSVHNLMFCVVIVYNLNLS
jgi:poly(rC)-binding protein 3/4